MNSIEKNVTIFGSFGFGNLGDELVPNCFRRLLNEAGIERNVEVLSRYAATKIGEAKPFPTLSDPYQASNHTVLVGGGVVEPRDFSCINRAFDLKSKRPNMKVAAHAISVEPGVSFSWSQRRRLERQVREIEFFTVRDVLSAEILMRLVPKASTRVIGDVGLWIEPAPLPVSLTEALPRRSIAVIVGDCWDTPDFINWLAAELILLARQINASVLLLPFSGQFGEDFVVNDRLHKRINCIDESVHVISVLDHLQFQHITPEIAAAIVQLSNLTVSSRLHGCVVSYAMGTPFVALGYHPKLRGFVETVGQRASLVPKNLPTAQSSNTYGYKFSELKVPSGVLSERAEVVMSHLDFSAVPYFQNLQIEAIRELFEQIETY